MKLLIVGHSHTTSLAQAARNMGVDHQLVRFGGNITLATLRREVAGAVSVLLGSDISEEMVTEVIADNGICTIATVGGNFHNVIGLLKHSKPYDFIVPGFENLPLASDYELIQYDAITDLFYFHLRRMFLAILDVRRVVGMNMVHIDSPPPPKSNEYIKDNIDQYFKDLFPGGLPDVNDPAIRFKHWSVAQALYERFCAEAGIDFLKNTLPRFQKYYLPKRYYGDDATHANAEFAKFYIARVVDS